MNQHRFFFPRKKTLSVPHCRRSRGHMGPFVFLKAAHQCCSLKMKIVEDFTTFPHFGWSSCRKQKTSWGKRCPSWSRPKRRRNRSARTARTWSERTRSVPHITLKHWLSGNMSKSKTLGMKGELQQVLLLWMEKVFTWPYTSHLLTC